MVMCFVPDCKHYSERDTCRYYTFPKDKKEAEKWITAIRRADREPSKYSLVCSCHFKDGIKKNGPSFFPRNSKWYMQFPSESKKRKQKERFVGEIKKDRIRCSNDCQMDTKIEIKEEYPLSDVSSQNEREFFTKSIAMKTNSDAMFLHYDCEMATKTEIKSETPFSDVCLQEEREMFTKHHVKQIKSETVTCSSNCEIDAEIEKQTLLSDLGSHSEREFLSGDPIVKDKKCSSDYETDCKIEFKEEHWHLETGTSSVFDDIKDGDIPPVKSPRLCIEAVSRDSNGKTALPPPEDLEKDTSFYNVKEHCAREDQESDVTRIDFYNGREHHECQDQESNFTRKPSGVRLFISKMVCSISFVVKQMLHRYINIKKRIHSCDHSNLLF